MMNLEMYRTTKEKVYLTICAIVGGLAWLIVLGLPMIPLFFLPSLSFLKFNIPLMALLLFLIMGWIAREFFKAVIFGNAVRVSENQYATIHNIALEMAKQLGLRKVPYIFIVNSDGMINAVALRFIGHSYVILFSGIVDLMLERNEVNELRMIIAHELAHHTAGHTSIWRNLLLKPALLIPFLGKAYRRACELTADRIGMVLTGELRAAQRALISLAGGTRSLSSDINISAFTAQEMDFLLFFGFIREILSSHPRITKRAILLGNYGSQMPALKASTRWLIQGVAGPLAGKSIDFGPIPLTIGRDPRSSNVILSADSDLISRRHCTLKLDGAKGGVVLEDCGSKNGTFLHSGQRLAPGTPYPLRPGERFYLGDPSIAFEVQRRSQ